MWSHQAERDYRYKRSEYAARGIAEYWVVDPTKQMVTVFEWVSGFYEAHEFEGETAIASPLMPQLSVKANQVLMVDEVNISE